jgi:hypothetical protein
VRYPEEMANKMEKQEGRYAEKRQICRWHPSRLRHRACSSSRQKWKEAGLLREVICSQLNSGVEQRPRIRREGGGGGGGGLAGGLIQNE